MFLIYNTLIILATLIFFPVLIVKIASHKNLKWGLKQRFTIFSRDFINSVNNQNLIWIHASSVGEVNLSRDVVNFLKGKLASDTKFLITAMTATGYDSAKQSGVFDYVTFIPFDISFLIKRFLKIFSPKIILIAETEFWPNIFRQAYLKKIPLLVFNCRISDGSVKNYNRFKFFFKKVLNCATFFLCQNEITCNRLKEIGVAKEKIIFAKNIKFDITFPEFSKKDIFQEFNIPDIKNKKIITTGSTHANEEEKILEILPDIMEKFPETLLILAPRHPERSDEISEIIEKKNIAYTLLSNNESKDFNILILDKIGFLIKAYAISDVCFIGGSLILRGGHNPLEALYFKKPVISGKNIFNFSEIYQMLEKNNGVVLVENITELKEKILKILTDEKYGEKIAINGYKVLKENRGALQITGDYILRCLY